MFEMSLSSHLIASMAVKQPNLENKDPLRNFKAFFLWRSMMPFLVFVLFMKFHSYRKLFATFLYHCCSKFHHDMAKR